MGFIYCYKSPEGKEYIGQTRRTIEIRDKEHQKDARNSNDKKKCRIFDDALVKFGRDNFTLTVLHECPIKELNKWEKHYIKERNSMHPNGYNLRNGGNGASAETSFTTLKLLSDSLRTKNKDLPMYMTCKRDKEDNIQGYGIRRHPKLNGRQLDFHDKHNIEEAYIKAMECLKYLNNLGPEEINTKYLLKPVGAQRKENPYNLPKYVKVKKNRKGQLLGFSVNTYKKDEPDRNFYGNNARENAIDYLNDLMQKRMQLRE